jgi:hypothetical protein
VIESHERRDALVIIDMIHFSTTLLYMCVELTCFSTRGIYVYVKEGYGKKGTMFSTLVEKIAKKNRSRLSIAVFLTNLICTR